MRGIITKNNMDTLLFSLAHGSPSFYVFLIVDVFIFLTVLRMLWKLVSPRMNIKKIIFTTERPGATKKILLLGDSTGVGTGASSEEDTIAGHLYKDFPHVSIRNRSVNGYRVRDLFHVLEEESSEKYDLVILSVGGNDTWHMSSLTRLEQEIDRVLDLCKKISNGHVVFLIYTNIGTAPVFPLFVRLYMKGRALAIRHMFIEKATAKNVIITDLFPENHFNKFELNPAKYFAPDGFHPNSEGYAIWYRALKGHIVLDPVGRP